MSYTILCRSAESDTIGYTPCATVTTLADMADWIKSPSFQTAGTWLIKTEDEMFGLIEQGIGQIVDKIDNVVPPVEVMADAYVEYMNKFGFDWEWFWKECKNPYYMAHVATHARVAPRVLIGALLEVAFATYETLFSFPGYGAIIPDRCNPEAVIRAVSEWVYLRGSADNVLSAQRTFQQCTQADYGRQDIEDQIDGEAIGYLYSPHHAIGALGAAVFEEWPSSAAADFMHFSRLMLPGDQKLNFDTLACETLRTRIDVAALVRNIAAEIE